MNKKTVPKQRISKGRTPAIPEVRNGAEPAFFSRQIAEARRFFLRLHAPWAERFNVVCGGSEHCSSEYRIQRDDFAYYVVEFVAQGEGTLVLNGTTHPLMTGA